jgi:hypothetical protein
VAWRRRDRRGRPRKPDALSKRRATTIEGRQPEFDVGTVELRHRKIVVANGFEGAVELTDVGGVLLAHGLLESEHLATLRLLSGWLRQIQIAFRLKGTSAAGLWAALMSGQRGGRGWAMPISAHDRPNTGDRALFRLGQVRELFSGPQRVRQLDLIMRIAIAESWPEDDEELIALRRGLAEIRDLQRRRRHASRSDAPWR